MGGVLKKSKRSWIRARVLERSNHRDIIMMVPREAGCRVHGGMPLAVGALLRRRNSTCQPGEAGRGFRQVIPG